MVISTRIRFILISVSITLLCLILFTSVLYDRAIKYKHQQEINTNRILADQFFQFSSDIVDLNETKYSVIENIARKTEPAKLFVILNQNQEVKFLFDKANLKPVLLDKILPQIKKNTQQHEGQLVDKDNKIYFWLLRTLPVKTEKITLLIVYPLSSSVATDVMKFFGLPFFISGFLLLWVMVWASIILSSLVNKLQNQKQILSVQAIDIEKARDEAVEANASKSNFLANMSHEIRTPLTSIIGFAESCSETECSAEDRARAVKTIIRSGKHLMNLINEILDLSKIEAGKLEINNSPVNLIDLLEEINQFVTGLAQGKDLNFGINYAFPLPYKIIIDPLRLKQILLNLCANAIKFTQKGYVYLNVSYDKRYNKLIFEVIDTGIGMKEEELEKIFRPFEQADASVTRKYGGTGLGLTLSRQLTEMLGGTLTVKSKTGKGSSFKVSLTPDCIEDSEYIYEEDINILPETHNQTDYELPILKGKILVAEDNEDIRELIKLMMKKLDLVPEVVENGKLAIKRAMEKEFDIIFFDIQMPIMDGITATKELRKQGYTKPIVAMTANAMQKDRDECLAAGFDNFISKPIDRKKLYEVMFKYLNPINQDKYGDIMLTSDLLAEDPDLIDLVDKFMTRLPEMTNAINQAFTDEEWEKFSDLIHQMKGVGGGYGYPMLTELCANIEAQLKEQSMDNVAKLMGELNHLAEQILAGSDENRKIANKA